MKVIKGIVNRIRMPCIYDIHLSKKLNIVLAGTGEMDLRDIILH